MNDLVKNFMCRSLNYTKKAKNFECVLFQGKQDFTKIFLEKLGTCLAYKTKCLTLKQLCHEIFFTQAFGTKESKFKSSLGTYVFFLDDYRISFMSLGKTKQKLKG